MADVLPVLIRAGVAAVASIGYAAVVERDAFVLREITMPVLSPGSTPLRVLHLSDLHMMPNQRRKRAWVRELAGWEPDLVVNTGDNLSHADAVGPLLDAMAPFLDLPGAFVLGTDTLVTTGGAVMGKPSSAAESLMSGII